MLRLRQSSASRVVLILVDGMHPGVTRRELGAGNLPNFEYIVRNGEARWDVVSVFPTSTPAAVTSIVTGATPARHRVPGIFWFDRETRAPVYYGETLSIIGQHFGPFFRNLTVNLNMRHLSRAVSTVFERIESRGRSSASINCLCFRGPHPHSTTLPVFLRMLPGVRFAHDEVLGPSFLRWGDFARSTPTDTRVFGEHGPFKQFGISDECTLQAFLEMAETSEIPDFLLLYFPDNDVWSHEHGPQAAGPHLRKWDGYLGRVLDAFGGKEHAIQHTNFLFVADHAQVPVGCGPDAIVDLDSLLGNFAVLRFGAEWNDEELFVCPNGRFAQLYLGNGTRDLRRRVIDCVSADRRIEQIMWREGSSYHVRTPDGRALSFTRGVRHRDRHANGWRWNGDLSVVGAFATKLHIEFEEFPDAFARIQGALDNPSAGEIILTAKYGYEFGANGDETHLGGGSHGGLLAEESYVPFVACGPDIGRRVDVASITDVQRTILDLMGLGARRLPFVA